MFKIVLFFFISFFSLLQENQKKYHEDWQFSDDIWSRILREEGKYDFNKDTFAVILPHHLIASQNMTKFYRGLSLVKNADLIVLLSPNHYEAGDNNIQTTDFDFRSFDGEIIKTEEFAKNNIIKKNNKTFVKEHGIIAHINFIKRFYPNTKILPIVLKWKTPKEELDKLVDFLNKNIDKKNTLIIGSIDFSHYNTQTIADFHDLKSMETIEKLFYEDYWNLEIDSPATLFVVSKLAEKNNYKNVDLIEHTNSQKWFEIKKIKETTSHLFIAFSNGEKKSKKNILNLQFFGNIFLNKENIKRNKEAEKYIVGEHSNKHYQLFSEIENLEKRFFMGNDFNFANFTGESVSDDILENYFFDKKFARIKKNTCENILKNKINVKFCRFENYKENEVLDLIKGNNDFVIIEINWNENKKNIKFAKKMVDNGANLIIGNNREKIDEVEIYKNSLIFYSIGDFIDNSKKGFALTISVSLEKINENKKNMKIYCTPVKKTDKTKYMDFIEKKKFFEKWKIKDSYFLEMI